MHTVKQAFTSYKLFVLHMIFVQLATIIKDKKMICYYICSKCSVHSCLIARYPVLSLLSRSQIQMIPPEVIICCSVYVSQLDYVLEV